MKVILIPARMESKRLPGKPLLEAGGKTLIQWVYELARKTKTDEVYVTTPDDRLVRYCCSKDIRVFKTSIEAPSGTHRCAEACLADFEVIVNLQVDEPLVSASDIDFLFYDISDIGTLVAPLEDKDRSSPNVVKVATSVSGCHWFRSF